MKMQKNFAFCKTILNFSYETTEYLTNQLRCFISYQCQYFIQLQWLMQLVWFFKDMQLF